MQRKFSIKILMYFIAFTDEKKTHNIISIDVENTFDKI